MLSDQNGTEMYLPISVAASSLDAMLAMSVSLHKKGLSVSFGCRETGSLSQKSLSAD